MWHLSLCHCTSCVGVVLKIKSDSDKLITSSNWLPLRVLLRNTGDVYFVINITIIILANIILIFQMSQALVYVYNGLGTSDQSLAMLLKTMEHTLLGTKYRVESISANHVIEGIALIYTVLLVCQCIGVGKKYTYIGLYPCLSLI